jgi:hypothetical protein
VITKLQSTITNHLKAAAVRFCACRASDRRHARRAVWRASGRCNAKSGSPSL